MDPSNKFLLKLRYAKSKHSLSDFGISPEILLLDMSSCWRFIKLPTSEGNAPDSMLSCMSKKLERVGIRRISIGTGPVNLFPCRSSQLSGQLARLGGMFPVSKFSAKRSWVNCVRFTNDAGIAPSSLFCSNSMSCNMFSLPTETGSVPCRRFPPIAICVRLTRFPISSGC